MSTTKKRAKAAAVAEGPRVALERVVGNSVVRSAGLAANAATGDLAYVAGAVVVVYNPRTGRQTRFLGAAPAMLASAPAAAAAPLPQERAAAAARALSCVACSANGRLVAAGEAGRGAAVHVWDAVSGQLLASLRGGHSRGVSCLAFCPSPSSSSVQQQQSQRALLVSVGGQGDAVCVWDVRSGSVVAQGRAGALVHAVSFAEDGSFFVTAGHRHLRYWPFDAAAVASAAAGTPAAIEGKSVALGSRRDSTFIDVACGRGPGTRGTVFAATAAGTLYGFNSARQMEKWVDLRSRVFALSVTEKFIACACADGNVRVFQPASLGYVMTLPKPHPLGRNIVADQQLRANPANIFPDAVACRLLLGDTRIACCYSDRSLYFWSIETSARAVKYRSFLSHSACIWDIAVVPERQEEAQPRPSAEEEDDAAAAASGSSQIPGGSFATSSSDGTLRVWNIDGRGPRNAYSKDLVHLLYTSSAVSAASGDGGGTTTTTTATSAAATGLPAHVLAMRAPQDYDKTDFAMKPHPALSGQIAVCCLAIRSDGKHLAIGDNQGNLKVIDLLSSEVLFDKPAHAAEILTVDFSCPHAGDDPILLASAGRDKLVHVFGAGTRDQPEAQYSLLCTISDHKATVTAVRFALSSHRMFSCTAENEIAMYSLETTTGQQPLIMRRVHTSSLQSGIAPETQPLQSDPVAPPASESPHRCATDHALSSMAIDPTEKILVSGFGHKLSLTNVATGKILRNYKGDGCCTLVRVEIDPAGLNVATSSSDKLVRLYDLFTGSLVARLGGHSDVVTGIKFTPDCRRIISVSGDGCAFVWALDPDTTRAMQDRIAENAAPPQRSLPPPRAVPASSQTPRTTTVTQQPPDAVSATTVHSAPTSEEEAKQRARSHDESLYVLEASETQLPAWAKDHHRREGSKSRPSIARGAWAQRVVDPSLVLLPTEGGDAPGSKGEPSTAAGEGEGAAFVGVVDHTKVEDVEEEANSSSSSSSSDDSETSAPATEEPGRRFEVSVSSDTGDDAETPTTARQQPQPPLVSPKLQMQDSVDDDDDFEPVLDAFQSLASPSFDQLRHSLSSEFMSGQQRAAVQQVDLIAQSQQAATQQRQPTIAAEHPQPPQPPASSSSSSAAAELQVGAGGSVRFAFATDASMPASASGVSQQQMIPTISPIADLLRPPEAPKTARSTPRPADHQEPTPPTSAHSQQTQPPQAPSAPAILPPKVLGIAHTQPPKQPDTRSPMSSPEVESLTSPQPSPSHRKLHQLAQPLFPLQAQQQPHRLAPDAREACARLREALTETIGLCHTAREHAAADVEAELHGFLAQVKKEISAFLSSSSDAETAPAETSKLEELFERFSKQLLEKIDQRIEERVHAEIEAASQQPQPEAADTMSSAASFSPLTAPAEQP